MLDSPLVVLYVTLVVEVVVAAVIKPGRIAGWRCHCGQIFPKCCMCVNVDGDSTSQRILIKG